MIQSHFLEIQSLVLFTINDFYIDNKESGRINLSRPPGLGEDFIYLDGITLINSRSFPVSSLNIEILMLVMLKSFCSEIVTVY